MELADVINRSVIANASFKETGKMVLDAYFKLAPFLAGRFHVFVEGRHFRKVHEKYNAHFQKSFLRKTGLPFNEFIPALRNSKTLMHAVKSGKLLARRGERTIRTLFAEQLNKRGHEPELKKFVDALKFRSVIIVPLMSGENLFGLVTLAGDRRLTDATLSRLKRFTRSITAAVAKTAAEDEARRQKEFNREVLESLPADLALFDENHRYIYVNPKAIADKTVRKWIIGKDDFDYCALRGIDESLAVRRRHRFVEALKGRTNQFWVDVHRTASGEERHIMRMFHPIFENDQFKYMVGYGVDITERVRAEDENRMLAGVVENSNDAIISTSIDGIVLTWNSGAEQLLGYPASEAIGKTIARIIPHDKMEELNTIRNRVRSGLAQSLQTSRLHRNGTRVEVSLSLFPLCDEFGNINALSAILRDIREQKRIEEEHVKLIRDLTHKYNELMQFNYIVSHNLRAPVTKILGLANVLKMPLSTDEKEKLTNHLFQSVEAMDVLIRDLGAILAARSPIHEKIESFTLLSVLENVKDNLERLANESNAEINIHVDPTADHITSIKSYIQSILFNLISNSIKYKARYRDPVIHISAKRKGPKIVIRVEDNGQGIDTEKYKDQLFGLYKRFSNDAEGKGLGLHMTKTQIESLGGEIFVESEPGKGSVFTISLPEAEAFIPVESA